MADGYGNDRPHFLSDEKVNWVVNTPGNSLFSVQVSRKELVPEAIKLYDNLVKSRFMVNKDPDSNKGPINITGFVIGEKRGMVRILTSTKGITSILPQQTDGSPSVEEIDLFFKFEVKCLHEEERCKKEGNEDGSPYWNAKVLRVDCRKDLLLLETDVKAKCGVDHPAIRLATSQHESKGMLVFLHGWAIHREGSVTRGRISHLGRQLKDVLGDPSKYRYDMTVIEIFDGYCSEGVSGGPVINGDLDCLGVFHSTYNDNGYATSWKDVIKFLCDFYRKLDGHDKNDAAEEREPKKQKIDSTEGGASGSSGLAASEKEKGTEAGR